MDPVIIKHFVGFLTQLNRATFVDQWAPFASKFLSAPGTVGLHEKYKGNSKYKFLSQHAFTEEAFSFSFMKGRESESFPDQTAKVVMLGGYTPVETARLHKGEITILVFLNKNISGIDSFDKNSDKFSLVVYQPFYENCTYDLILEFVTDEAYTPVIIDELLQKKENIEISACKNCDIPYSVYNTGKKGTVVSNGH